MNIIFVEPFFPQNQRRFVAALAGVGATVSWSRPSDPSSPPTPKRSTARSTTRILGVASATTSSPSPPCSGAIAGSGTS